MFRKVAIAIWVCVLLGGIVSYFVWPDVFAPESIASFLNKFQNEMLLAYLGISIFRGLTMIPSTPFVIAGTLIFPQQPIIVLAISMFGILLSSSMIYWFSDLLGISEFFESRKPKLVHKIKAQLERPTGLLFVFLWAFFPLVPTDAVCYVAGTTRMAFLKFILAVFLGEIILCSFYVFAGRGIFSFIFF